MWVYREEGAVGVSLGRSHVLARVRAPGGGMGGEGAHASQLQNGGNSRQQCGCREGRRRRRRGGTSQEEEEEDESESALCAAFIRSAERNYWLEVSE